MRLSADEITAIKAAAREAFGETVVVRLFGSRTDDSKRGGDIDLLFEVDRLDDEWHAKGRFLDRLFTRIDERRVDMVVAVRGQPADSFAAMVRPLSVALP